ncbi:hypothetical protein HK096_000400 [Nowakowskiella sp. JEL0078]|nr:hypothetical protein HK096_000400 [Nowakowskiella sp. JEL0078]
MKALFSALNHMHSKNIIHRDIKPSNFLYDMETQTGVLVDFGLAQKYVFQPKGPERVKFNASKPLNGRSIMNKQENFKVIRKLQPGYLINDPRPQIRANRAGTRGFRAPEVLMKVPHQTMALDVWAAGIMLLSIFGGRYPFFHSPSDAESLVEIAIIFGRDKISEVTAHFNREFLTNIPIISDTVRSLKVVCNRSYPDRPFDVPEEGWDFLDQCLCLNPEKRIRAEEALKHPFLNSITTKTPTKSLEFQLPPSPVISSSSLFTRLKMEQEKSKAQPSHVLNPPTRAKQN